MNATSFGLATALVLGLAFLAAAAAAAAVVRAVPEALRRRHPDLVGHLWSEGGRRRSAAPFRAWRLAVAVASREIGRRTGAAEKGWLANLERDLRRSGAPAGESPERFLARALLEGAGLTLGLALLSQLTLGRPLLLLALGSGLFHSLLVRPQMLRSAARERLGAILRRLPYAMDLMVLVVEAGGTLDEALETVTASRREGDPLAVELSAALAEVGAGGTRSAAFRRLAERLDLDELTSLVAALERAQATGAPVAETLEAQSEMVQRRRMQRAEKLAVEAPVKMMFPNMLILIAVLLIVLGPIFVQLVTEDLI